MKWRSGWAAALLLAAAPLAAQETGGNSAARPPPPVDNIGPRELSNFSLEGRVTRPAERQPAAEPPAAIREPQPRAPAPTVTTAARPQPRPAVPQAEAGRAAADVLSQPPTLSGPTSPAGAAAAATSALTGLADLSPPPPPPDSGFSPLPWIAALLLLGAGAVIYFGRQGRRQRYAAAAPQLSREFLPAVPDPAPSARPEARKPPPTHLRQPAAAPVPTPAPAPIPAGVVTTRLPRPAAPPLVPAGIISTSLRPWLDVEFEPSQATIDDQHAAIAFDVTLFNSGSAPARDVVVEACLINAGKEQDGQLAQFYATPGAKRDAIPIIAPFARVSLKSVVRLPRAAVQEYVVEGRKLFVPMVALNSLYRWSSGEGQSAASFLVGKGGDKAAKLAPLRIDQGARGWKGLSARRYEKGVRR